MVFQMTAIPAHIKEAFRSSSGEPKDATLQHTKPHIQLHSATRRNTSAGPTAGSETNHNIMEYLRNTNAAAPHMKGSTEATIFKCARTNDGSGLKEQLSQMSDPREYVNIIDMAGYSPLHVTMYYNTPKAAQVLLTHGCDVDFMRNGTGAAIHIAVERGHKKMVKMLLEHGADATSLNSENMTPIDLAWRGGHSKIATMLQEHMRPVGLDRELGSSQASSNTSTTGTVGWVSGLCHKTANTKPSQATSDTNTGTVGWGYGWGHTTANTKQLLQVQDDATSRTSVFRCSAPSSTPESGPASKAPSNLCKERFMRFFGSKSSQPSSLCTKSYDRGAAL
eukprot:gene30378-35386_t